MSTNILDAVVKLAAIKQLDKELIQKIILESINNVLNKKLEPENKLELLVDENTSAIKANFLCKVVEVEKNLGEISLEEARKIYGEDVELGQYVPKSMAMYEFEPKLIKTAQKAIQDKIHQLEEEKIRNDFDKQKNTIVSGKIKSIDDNGNYRIDIGYSDAILPVDEQIENEYYRVGDNIKAYVVNIQVHKNHNAIILSRTNPEFVKKLFETEIPEIYDGTIKILKIVREPGVRTKVEIESTDPKLDPIAACIGIKGTRIDSIRRELHGEQIDLVVHDEDPDKLIVRALGLENVKRVILERNRAASVIVDDDNKVIAIGKGGKNVKLAAKLTGMKIDIYTMEEFEEKMAKERRTISHITELDGVTPKIAEILRHAGYTSVQDIYAASIEELCNLEGVGEKTAQKLKGAARDF
ncbi:MAG: transcription termination factor NusA [Candidatus Cloacimonadaceae bacterium]|jgi:N utilization substance protein A|nr:transcription termination factor NusA [Candidatus Cloacimonadota bacterium]MCB5257925.1 transcription termination factor NusA [Candidatus Cloacimonadota bacterium]MDD5624560.1 transcription termination factor NusA [Candidatus Cloacimonadota bacterium]MDY0111650.1 transcription termination factor NusA [Candidatus Syntrophosphaera sp.]